MIPLDTVSAFRFSRILVVVSPYRLSKSEMNRHKINRITQMKGYLPERHQLRDSSISSNVSDRPVGKSGRRHLNNFVRPTGDNPLVRAFTPFLHFQTIYISHRSCAIGIMMKDEHNKWQSGKQKQCTEFTTHGSSSILHIYVIGYLSRSMILLWAWYYSVAQIGVQDWLRKCQQMWSIRSGPSRKLASFSRADLSRIIGSQWNTLHASSLTALFTKLIPP